MITVPLSVREMKYVTGGWDPENPYEDDCETPESCEEAGGGGGLPHFPCGYSRRWDNPMIYCAQSAGEAALMAGPDGWWCCRCGAIENICGPW